MRRAGLTIALMALGTGAAVQLATGAPMLMKPPFPQDFIFPKPRFDGVVPLSAPPSFHLPKVCFLYDVSEKGEVSNLKVIQSSGVSNADKVVTEWYLKRLMNQQRWLEDLSRFG